MKTLFAKRTEINKTKCFILNIIRIGIQSKFEENIFFTQIQIIEKGKVDIEDDKSGEIEYKKYKIDAYFIFEESKSWNNEKQRVEGEIVIKLDTSNKTIEIYKFSLRIYEILVLAPIFFNYYHSEHYDDWDYKKIKNFSEKFNI